LLVIELVLEKEDKKTPSCCCKRANCASRYHLGLPCPRGLRPLRVRMD